MYRCGRTVLVPVCPPCVPMTEDRRPHHFATNHGRWTMNPNIIIVHQPLPHETRNKQHWTCRARYSRRRLLQALMISTAMSALNVTEDEKHACELEVTFSSAIQAEQAMQIMQVDQEPTDRVTKSFALKTSDDVTSLVV